MGRARTRRVASPQHRPVRCGVVWWHDTSSKPCTGRIQHSAAAGARRRQGIETVSAAASGAASAASGSLVNRHSRGHGHTRETAVREGVEVCGGSQRHREGAEDAAAGCCLGYWGRGRVAVGGVRRRASGTPRRAHRRQSAWRARERCRRLLLSGRGGWQARRRAGGRPAVASGGGAQLMQVPRKVSMKSFRRMTTAVMSSR